MTTQEIIDLKILIDEMTINELIKHLANTPGHYSDYSSLNYYLKKNYSDREIIFKKLYDFFEINFENKSILDLGPGTGESLDVAKNRGASKMEFIDREIITFRYNELKGYTGHLFDYTTPAINEFNMKYDIVISKGSFNSDSLNEHKHQLLFRDIINWIELITRELIIIIPTFSGLNEFKCVDYQSFMKSEFSEELFSHDFKTAFIDGCNSKDFFPVTFFKII